MNFLRITHSGTANRKVSRRFPGVPEMPRNFSKLLRMIRLSAEAETLGAASMTQFLSDYISLSFLTLKLLII